MVWSLALRSDDAKQNPVVYGTKFGVVFLAEGPRTASIQEGFDCFGLYHPGLVLFGRTSPPSKKKTTTKNKEPLPPSGFGRSRLGNEVGGHCR